MSFGELSFEKIKEFIGGEKVKLDTKEKEVLEKIKASYDSLTTFILLKEEELKKNIEETRLKLVDELSKISVATKETKKDFEMDLQEIFVEIRIRQKELLSSYDELLKETKKLKEERDRFFKTSVVLAVVVALLVGSAVGFFASKFISQNTPTKTVSQGVGQGYLK